MDALVSSLDGEEVYNTVPNNIMGSRTILETILEEPKAQQSPQLRKALIMINVVALHAQAEHNK